MLASVVPNEVVGQFHLGSQTEVDVVHSLEFVEVEPELWLRLDDPFPVDVGIVPDVAVAAEGAEAVGEGR